MNESQREAIRQADAYTSNAGLPSYSELVEAARRVESDCNKYMPRHRLLAAPIVTLWGLLQRVSP